MKKLLILTLFTVGIAFSGAAFALDLSQARAQGLVGEKLDGYVGVVKPSADAQAVASDVNSRRRAEYENISKQNSQPVSVVGKVAAETIINNLPSGSYYQGTDGSWKKK
jgi:hypothetical protein